MAGIFRKIIDGEIPARIVWRDPHSLAFLDIAPNSTGHTLLIPLVEVDHWLDLPPEVLGHLMNVAHIIGRAQKQAFASQRIGMVIAGFDVPHTHLHLIPANAMGDLGFSTKADSSTAALDSAAAELRATLGDQGATHVVDG